MADRVRVFSRTGKLLAEFTTNASRSWTIGEEGRAAFEVSTNETFCNETVLQFYNWILIENPLLPAWVGTIGVYNWGARKIGITCYSPDSDKSILGRRIGPNEKVINTSPGGQFEYLINTANAAEKTILRVGDIYKGGIATQKTFNPKQISKYVKEVQKSSKEDYIFRPVVGNDGLLIYCDWQKRMGVDTVFTLEEGSGGGNIEYTQRVLVSDAPEANSIFGYGDGQAWTSKPTTTTNDADSISKYGLLQFPKNYSGVTNVSTITTNAKADLQDIRNPSDVYSVFALNVGDTFAYMKLGNKVNLSMEHVGFSSGNLGTTKYVRIRGMFYDPSKGDKIEIGVSENVTT